MTHTRNGRSGRSIKPHLCRWLGPRCQLTSHENSIENLTIFQLSSIHRLNRIERARCPNEVLFPGRQCGAVCFRGISRKTRWMPTILLASRIGMNGLPPANSRRASSFGRTSIRSNQNPLHGLLSALRPIIIVLSIGSKLATMLCD